MKSMKIMKEDEISAFLLSLHALHGGNNPGQVIAGLTPESVSHAVPGRASNRRDTFDHLMNTMETGQPPAGIEESVVRQCVPEDGEQLNGLYNRIFGLNRPLDAWRWRYLRNPATSHIMIVVAEQEGRLIGQYAGFPREFMYRGKRLPFVYSQDTFTDPNAKKDFTLLLRLFTAAAALGREAGYLLGFGFPHATRIYGIGKKVLGYKDVADMVQIVRRLNWFLAIKMRNAALATAMEPIIRNVSALFYQFKLALRPVPRRVVETRTIGPEFDALWERQKDRYPLIGVRDAKYLRWRFLEKPECEYTLLTTPDGNGGITGYMVLRVKPVDDSTVGHVIDYLCDDMESFDSLLTEGLKRFVGRRVDFAICLTPPGSEFEQRLTRHHGFARKSFTHRIPLVYQDFSPEIDEATVKDPANWYVTFADTADL
jgi:hypothetical protein